MSAVGDRSVSPSVFYYYFANKDELYRAAVEGIANSYVAGFKKVFANDKLSLNEQLMELIEVMHKSLTANRMLIFTDIYDKNRSFILEAHDDHDDQQFDQGETLGSVFVHERFPVSSRLENGDGHDAFLRAE